MKGDPRVSMPLEFVRVEPYIIPKISLTGSSTERVDTRVLQVIYALPNEHGTRLFVGQQMDVFLDLADTLPRGVALKSAAQAKTIDSTR